MTPARVKTLSSTYETFLTTHSYYVYRRWETVRRVVEGTFSLQYKWATDRRLGWNHNRVGVAYRVCAHMYAHVMCVPPVGRYVVWMEYVCSRIIDVLPVKCRCDQCGCSCSEMRHSRILMPVPPVWTGATESGGYVHAHLRHEVPASRERCACWR